MYGGYGGGRGGGRGGGGRSKNVWVRPGSNPAPATAPNGGTQGSALKAGGDGAADAKPPPATTKPPPNAAKGASLSAKARSYTPASNTPASNGEEGDHVGRSFLPVGVKRKAGENERGAGGPKRQHLYVDPALQEKQKKAAEAKAELEAKIAAAKEEAERMKRSIEETAAKAKARKEEAQREEHARKELELKEKHMEKQKKQKAASNLLSGFAAARKKHGVGTADGPKTTEPTPEVELTQEEKDRQEVRRVMMATSDWQVLNLVPNAQPKWVKQAYRELAKVLHPDKCKAPGAKDAFQKLSKAYQNINAMQA